MSKIVAGARPSAGADPQSLARFGLLAGAVVPPLFVLIVVIDSFVHPAYNQVTDYVSELSRGQLGWLQSANFLVCGMALLGFAAGIRWAVRPGPGSVAGAALFALMGGGVIVDAFFTIDPHTSTVHTPTGVVHAVGFVVVSVALIVACFVFARRLRGALRMYSVASGILLPVSLVVTVVAGTPLGITGILQRIFLLIGWAWIAVLALSLLAESRRDSAAS
jgi:hypothetical protein